MSGMDVLLQMAAATVQERRQALLQEEYELEQTESRVRTLREQRSRLDEEERLRRGDPTRGRDFGLLRQLTLLEQVLKRAVQRQDACRDRVEVCRQACVEARQRESVLRRLEDRRQLRHRHWLDGLERRELDEAGLQSYRRTAGERRR